MTTLFHNCGTPTGTRKHYAHGEKPCKPCHDAKKEYDYNYYRAHIRIANPGIEKIDNSEARQEIQKALKRGCTLSGIARTCKLSDRAIKSIHAYESERSKRATVDAIVENAHKTPIGRANHIDAKFTGLRLQNLINNGVSRAWIADQLETSVSQIHEAVDRSNNGKQVRKEFAQKVDNLVLKIGRGEVKPIEKFKYSANK